jgi:hypothetical protein
MPKEDIRSDFCKGDYIGLFLNEVFDKPMCSGRLGLPLTLACLLSEYFPLIFPMKGAASRLIDSIFDDVLKAVAHSDDKAPKRFAANSKGILYSKILAVEEWEGLQANSMLILTTDRRVVKKAIERRIPHVLISHCKKAPKIRISGIDRIKDERLRLNLVKCTELSLKIYMTVLIDHDICDCRSASSQPDH